MSNLDKTYWDKRYREGNTGWDLGNISPSLKAYIDQLENKELKILIPGGGNAYELSYLHGKGFSNSYLIDLSPTVINNFLKRNPTIDKKYLIEGNFFEHKSQYDLILEQTFFCAINRSLRQAYVNQVYNLLKSKGKLVGLLWSVDPVAQELDPKSPPFGGTKEEYINYFSQNPVANGFKIETLEAAYNSISPRSGKELFLITQKK